MNEWAITVWLGEDKQEAELLARLKDQSERCEDSCFPSPSMYGKKRRRLLLPVYPQGFPSIGVVFQGIPHV